MFTPFEAEQAIEQALAQKFPETRFRLDPLKSRAAALSARTYRAKAKGAATTYVCKAARKSERGQAGLLYAYEQMAKFNPLMSGDMRVPKPIYFDSALCTFIMEDTKGETAYSKLGTAKSQRTRQNILRRAGGWLAAFFAIEAQSAPFDPVPRAATVFDAVKAHLAGERPLHRFNEHAQALDTLSNLVQHTAQTSVPHGPAHGDFHGHNLILRGNGQTYGFDFRPAPEGPWAFDMARFVAAILDQSFQSAEITARPDDEWRILTAPFGPNACTSAVAKLALLSFGLRRWVESDATKQPDLKTSDAMIALALSL